MRQYNKTSESHKFKELDIGQTYTTNRGEQMIIICRYAPDSQYYLAEFLETGNRQYVNARQWARSIDKSKPFLFDRGFFKCNGEPIAYFEKKPAAFYGCWVNMMTRCYKKTDQFKPWENVTVCEEWMDFTNFYHWAEQQPFKVGERIQLDKDLFSPADKKMYSPETSCFLPANLNSSLIKASYDELHGIVTSPRTKQLCANIACRLLSFEDVLSKRVCDALWKVCEVNGSPREMIVLKEKCREMKEYCEKLEKQNKTLTDIKDAYERRDLDGKLLQEQLPLVPLRGFVQLNAKTYRIESGKDLYNMLNMTKDVILNAPKPQASK